jgi:hypothetical protein
MTFDETMLVYRDGYTYAMRGQDEDTSHAFGFYLSEQWKDSTYDEYVNVANFANEWVRFSQNVGA